MRAGCKADVQMSVPRSCSPSCGGHPARASAWEAQLQAQPRATAWHGAAGRHRRVQHALVSSQQEHSREAVHGPPRPHARRATLLVTRVVWQPWALCLCGAARAARRRRGGRLRGSRGRRAEARPEVADGLQEVIVLLLWGAAALERLQRPRGGVQTGEHLRSPRQAAGVPLGLGVGCREKLNF